MSIFERYQKLKDVEDRALAAEERARELEKRLGSRIALLERENGELLQTLQDLVAAKSKDASIYPWVVKGARRVIAKIKNRYAQDAQYAQEAVADAAVIG